MNVFPPLCCFYSTPLPFHFTVTVNSCVPHGDLKVTLKLPVVLLIEVMVNLSEAVSALPCGSRRMMMSDQFEVTALMPARLLLPSRRAMTLAVPPLLLNSNGPAFKTSAHPV